MSMGINLAPEMLRCKLIQALEGLSGKIVADDILILEDE